MQREVLDVVDSSSSAIVVAPTSSGKTFISDYVCNHVMQHGGRVVFVAPTKALVNQQHAQVNTGSAFVLELMGYHCVHAPMKRPSGMQPHSSAGRVPPHQLCAAQHLGPGNSHCLFWAVGIPEVLALPQNGTVPMPS